MYLDDYKRWLEADLIDCDLGAELRAIEGDDEAGSLTPQIPERRLQPYFFGQIQIPYFS